jgi:hypothetical protein
LAELQALFGRTVADELFNQEQIVRRIVVTVDNLSQHALPPQYSPFKGVPGEFKVSGTGDDLTLGAENFPRYTSYIRAFTGADVSKAVAAYVRRYPLFQTAFRELGTRGYFNDRLVAVIDDCLEAPEPPSLKTPLKLTQTSVRYKFADEAIEALSACQRILLRIGPANAGSVKTKLREVREKVVHVTASASASASG